MQLSVELLAACAVLQCLKGEHNHCQHGSGHALIGLGAPSLSLCLIPGLIHYPARLHCSAASDGAGLEKLHHPAEMHRP